MTDQELISGLWRSAGSVPGEWNGNVNAYGYMRAAARRLESLLGISMNTAAALRYHPADPQAKPAADGCICGTTIKGICPVHGGRLDNTQRADYAQLWREARVKVDTLSPDAIRQVDASGERVGYGKANYEASTAPAPTAIALSLAPVPAAPTMRQVVLTCGGQTMRLDAIFPSPDEALAAIARILEGEFAADEARRSE